MHCSQAITHTSAELYSSRYYETLDILPILTRLMAGDISLPSAAVNSATIIQIITVATA